MVTTGVPRKFGRKTEIINLAGQDTCLNLEDFPIGLSEAVGANIQGTPFVCGGSSATFTSSKCYHFINGTWQLTTAMREERHRASIIVYKNKMHIMGGLGVVR